MKTECPVCDFRSRKHGQINKHIRDSRDPKHSVYAEALRCCRICGKVYKTTQGRSKHSCTENERVVANSPSRLWLTSTLSCEERIHQLGQSSPQAEKLLIVLCTFDAQKIPEILFWRLWNTRKCWGPNGDIEHVTIQVLHTPADPLFDEMRFKDCIRCLESFGFLESKDGALGKREFSINAAIRECVTGANQDQDRLQWKCRIVICHAFPGTREEIGLVSKDLRRIGLIVPHSFGDLGRVLLPLVRHALTCYSSLKDKIAQYPTTGYGIILTILLSSYIGDRDWKLNAIDLAGKLLSCLEFGSGTSYLQKLRKQREREVSRRLPNTSIGSLCEEELPMDPRTNALYGEYLRSNAQDLIMQNCNLYQALQESLKYKFYSTIPSEMEAREKYRHGFLEGKILRWTAHFPQAADVLYHLRLSEYFTFDEAGCNIINHYVGVLCELRNVDLADSIARQAVLDFERLDQLGLKRNGLMSFRLLRLAYAETLICKALIHRADVLPYTPEILEKLDGAERNLCLLKIEYETSKSERGLSWGSEMNYLRVCMGRALISHLLGHLEESYKRWAEVRQPAYDCKDVVTNFVPMIIDYSMCEICLQLGNLEEAAVFLDMAKAGFEHIGREHWWTGLGTFLLDIFMTSIPNSGICKMSGPRWEIASMY